MAVSLNFELFLILLISFWLEIEHFEIKKKRLMKAKDIKEMNSEERLKFAIIKAKFYSRQVSYDIIEEHKFSFKEDRKQLVLWFNIALHMHEMRGITIIGRYNLLM